MRILTNLPASCAEKTPGIDCMKSYLFVWSLDHEELCEEDTRLLVSFKQCQSLDITPFEYWPKPILFDHPFWINLLLLKKKSSLPPCDSFGSIQQVVVSMVSQMLNLPVESRTSSRTVQSTNHCSQQKTTFKGTWQIICFRIFWWFWLLFFRWYQQFYSKKSYVYLFGISNSDLQMPHPFPLLHVYFLGLSRELCLVVLKPSRVCQSSHGGGGCGEQTHLG